MKNTKKQFLFVIDHARHAGPSFFLVKGKSLQQASAKLLASLRKKAPKHWSDEKVEDQQTGKMVNSLYYDVREGNQTAYSLPKEGLILIR